MPEKTPKPEFLTIEEILANIKKYNKRHPAKEILGFDPETEYDALVMAPGWRPDMMNIEHLFPLKTAQKAYVSAFELEDKGTEPDDKIRIAWVQCASGAANLLDHMLICHGLKYKTLFFVGSAGALTNDFSVGDLVTPAKAISLNLGVGAYLRRKLYGNHPMPFPEITQSEEAISELENAAASLFPDKTLKKADVFCTESIALEYSHVGEILKTGAGVIEMETAAYLQAAPMMGVPYYILLALSDSIADRQGLIGSERNRGREEYLTCRDVMIPKLVCEIARRKRNAASL